jgi:methionine biosynthesis protein MetW
VTTAITYEPSPYTYNERKHGTHGVVLSLVPAGSRVLDVGCATGYLGAALAARDCRVRGLDRDERALRRAEGAYEEVLAIDLEGLAALRWPEASFDVIVAADVLEHLRDPASALRLLAGYLRTDGRLVVSVPNVAHVSVRLPLLLGRFTYTTTGILDSTHLRFYTFATARALVESCGLRVQGVFAGSNAFGFALNRVPGFGRLKGLLAYNVILACTRATSPS